MIVKVGLDEAIECFSDTEKLILKQITNRIPRKNSYVNFKEIADRNHVTSSVTNSMINKLNLLGIIKTMGCGQVGTKFLYINREALRYLNGIL